MSYDLKVNIIYKDSNEESILYSYWDSKLKCLSDRSYSSELDHDIIDASNVELINKPKDATQSSVYSYSSIKSALTRITDRLTRTMNTTRKLEGIFESVDYYKLTDSEQDKLAEDIEFNKSMLDELKSIRNELIGLIYIIDIVMNNNDKFIEDNYYISIGCY